MAVNRGTVVYSLPKTQAIGQGIEWSAQELDNSLTNGVVDAVFDIEGKQILADAVGSIADTNFNGAAIEAIINHDYTPVDWQIGEAISEVYLTDHYNCIFPWPDGRDIRREKSSLPGADLVGFIEASGSIVFAFGEVKTSSEMKYPPGAMYGETGLKQQLEDLRDKKHIKDTLVKYLMYRFQNTSWESSFKAALVNYSKSYSNVYLFGFLIRDVPHDEGDLRARVNALDLNCPTDTNVKLFALYLPSGTIPLLSQKVITLKAA